MASGSVLPYICRYSMLHLPAMVLTIELLDELISVSFSKKNVFKNVQNVHTSTHAKFSGRLTTKVRERDDDPD